MKLQLKPTNGDAPGAPSPMLGAEDLCILGAD